MKTKIKLMLSLILAINSGYVLAQTEEKQIPSVKISEHYNKRAELINKYKDKDSIIIGVFPGTVANVNVYSYLARYLPLANYLTTSTNELVSFVPELSVKNWKELNKDEKYQLLYVNAEIAVSAVKAGYEPLVQRSEKIISVVLTKEKTQFKDLEELKTKKVGAIPQAMVSTLAKARFKRENLKIDLISAGSTGQKDLILGLDNNVVDAVVLRKETADELIKKSPGLYKIAFTLEQAPGFILLARKDTPQNIKDSLSKSMLALTVDNAHDKAILVGLDTKISTFEKASVKDVENFNNITKDVITQDKK